jgi:hypothetical protein
MRFCNTSYLDFGHNGSFQKRARNCAQFLMRTLVGQTDIPDEFVLGKMSEAGRSRRISEWGEEHY